MYINGYQVGESKYIGRAINGNNRNVSIGRHKNLYFYGIMNEVRLYNRSLTNQEALENYMGNVTQDGIVSMWKFEQEVDTIKSFSMIIFSNAFQISTFLLITSIIAGIGGITALMRKYFYVALLGAVFGIIAGFFIVIIGSFLGVAALIVLILSKEEFKRKPMEIKY
jgi:hypothetical protein